MNRIIRLLVLGCGLLVIGALGWAGDDSIEWHPASECRLEGQAWTETGAPFDRFPARAEASVRAPVWDLSRQSAGLCLRFSSDAPAIHARWSLTSESLAMPHMAASGVSGLDLYVMHEGQWRWLGMGKPQKRVGNVAKLAHGLGEGWRDYMLYLPLYNGTASVEIGLPSGTHLKAAEAREEGERTPIVFYGTSITQGACASRPGMAHTAILGRRLGREVINLGFSGQGTMDLSVGELLAEIDAAVYVIDCLPNMRATQVAERTRPLLQALRKARPDVPILLVEDRSYGWAFLASAARERNQASRAELKSAHDSLRAEGFTALFYLPGANLVGQDGEGLVDGSHPSDLGFMRQADAFESPLRQLLKR
ncbi:MAG: lysophospholipase L1-like esterase [Candidatus Paceibacteria bacterium]|jgi:lysophospholipase L1-like esterase